MDFSSLLSLSPQSYYSLFPPPTPKNLHFSPPYQDFFSPKPMVSLITSNMYSSRLQPVSPRTQTSFSRSNNNEGVSKGVTVFTELYDLKMVEDLVKAMKIVQTKFSKMETIYVGEVDQKKNVYGFGEVLVETWMLSHPDYLFEVWNDLHTLKFVPNINWITKLAMESDKQFVVVSVRAEWSMEDIRGFVDKLNKIEKHKRFVWFIIQKYDENRPVAVFTSKEEFNDLISPTLITGNKKKFYVVVYRELLFLQKIMG